jgi:uncharacterized protein YdhG (YjbR/CyaY superfamily)
MTDSVQDYLDAISPENRPLFDRVHRLVLDAHPDAETVLSYKMPTYVVGDRRLHVGVWKHGLSFYGWRADHDGGFTARHPELTGDKGTIRLSPEAAAGITDEDLRGLVGGALDA